MPAVFDRLASGHGEFLAELRPAVAQASRAMAIAFGLDRIVIDRDRPTDPAASSFLSNTAILRGKPAITTEVGDRSRVEEDRFAPVP